MEEFNSAIKYVRLNDRYSVLRVIKAWLGLSDADKKAKLSLVLDTIHPNAKKAKLESDMSNSYMAYCQERENGKSNYHSWSNYGERLEQCIVYMKSVIHNYCLLQPSDQELCFETCVNTIKSLINVSTSEFKAFDPVSFITSFAAK